MFNKSKRKAITWLEAPSRENEKVFHHTNIELSEIYWSLANEDILGNIERGLEKILMERQIPGEGAYLNLSDEEVIELFEQEKLNLFRNIPLEISKAIQERINKLLKQNRNYVKAHQMNIPENNNLTIEEYYLNYKISKEIIKLLEIQTYKAKK